MSRDAVARIVHLAPQSAPRIALPQALLDAPLHARSGSASNAPRRRSGTRAALSALLVAVGALTLPHAARAQGGTLPVAPAPAPTAGPAARALSLREALELARRNAPAVQQARGEVRAANAALRTARGAYIPQFALTGSTTEQSPATARVNPTTGEIVAGRWATNAGFNASVDLFDGFRRSYDVRAARAVEAAAGSAVAAQEFDVALEVKQQFFASLAAREAQAAALAQREQALQQLRISVARVRAQTATRSDSLRARILLNQADLALVTAANDQQVADAALARLIGAPFAVTASPQGLADESRPVPDSAQLVALAEQGPAVRQADASVDAARASARSARAAYLPTLSLAYGRNLLGSSSRFDPLPDPLRYSGQLRFGVNYPLFTQFAREETVVRADVAATNAEVQRRNARLVARETLVQALGGLRVAQAQLVTQASSVLAAEEDLRVQQQRYELGASTLLDVLTSQTQLTQARLAQVQARFAARSARAQLETLIGRDL